MNGKSRVLGGLFLLGVTATSVWLGLEALKTPPKGIEPLSPVKLDDYMGPWEEIARMDNALERDLVPTLLLYPDPSSETSVRLVLAGGNAKTKEWQKIQMDLEWTGHPDVASFETKCLGPIRCGLHVIASDDKHRQWIVVTGYSRDYLWILARVPGLDDKTFAAVMKRVTELGYDVSKLQINNVPTPIPEGPEAPEVMPDIPSMDMGDQPRIPTEPVPQERVLEPPETPLEPPEMPLEPPQMEEEPPEPPLAPPPIPGAPPIPEEQIQN